MEKLPKGRPSGHPNLLNPLEGGLIGIAVRVVNNMLADLVLAINGATGGIFNLGPLAADLRGTKETANNAQNTAESVAASASNLAEIYNFDVAANRTKFPAVAPFSYVSAGYAYSGSWVTLLQPAPGYPENAVLPVGQKFRVTPAEKIYMEWRQRRSGADFEARLNLVVLDSSDAIVLADLSPIQPSTSATDNAWVKYSGVVEIPVGAYTARPELKMQLLAGGTPAGSWAFDNVIVRRAVEADLSGIEAALAGKADYSDIPTNIPLWQNINPTDDAVFPLSQNVFHSRANTSSSGSTTTFEDRAPSFATTSGEMDLGYIRSTRDREYTQVGLMTSRGGLVGSGPFELWLHLYKMNPANGDLSLLWSSGNVKAAVQSAGAGNQVRFNMPQIHANQGDVFAIGLVQRANALNPSYSIYGLKAPWVNPPAGVFPRGLSSRANVGTTFPSPSSITSASMVWDDDRVPWFVLG